MKLTAYLFLLPLAASSVLLSACGGAADGGPVVTNMLATTPRFSQVMTITVAGQALDLGIEVAVDGGPCANLTASAGATATSAQYTCVVNGVGNLVPRVRNTTSRRELASLQLTVPMPQVTVAVTQGSRSGSLSSGMLARG